MHYRPAEARGHANHGWLDSHHSFSFADYHDPAHMGFGALRVINEDRVEAGAGFPPHGHRDMEIISYVLEGALEHKDSIGTGSVIHPGEVQRMSAGSGITHSEYNPSTDTPVHFLQIWIIPERQGIAPGYEQKAFPDAERSGKLRLVGARDGRDGALTIHQDVDLYASLLDAGETVDFELRPDRQAWLQVTRGALEIGGQALKAGDELGVTEVGAVSIASTDASEFLLFDLAA